MNHFENKIQEILEKLKRNCENETHESTISRRKNKTYRNYNEGDFRVLEFHGRMHQGGSSEIYIVTGEFKLAPNKSTPI